MKYPHYFFKIEFLSLRCYEIFHILGFETVFNHLFNLFLSFNLVLDLLKLINQIILLLTSYNGKSLLQILKLDSIDDMMFVPCK